MAFVFGFFVISNSPLLAQVTTAFETLEGTFGEVNVYEAVLDLEFGSVAYSVDVLGSEQVFALGVSYNDIVGFADLTSSLPGWGSEVIGRFDWDNGEMVTLQSGIEVALSDLGTFDSLFGPTDNTVAFYFLEEGAGLSQALTDGNDIDFANYDPFAQGTFQREVPLLFSDFVALNNNGQLIDASRIPEPSSSLLCLLGMTGFLRRKR